MILEYGVKGRATLTNDNVDKISCPVEMVRVLLEITELVYKYALITAEGTH